MCKSASRDTDEQDCPEIGTQSQASSETGPLDLVRRIITIGRFTYSENSNNEFLTDNRGIKAHGFSR